MICGFAQWDWIKLSGQSQGVLFILVIGAATDYAFLVVARYRAALQHVDSKWAALGRAWRAARAARVTAAGAEHLAADGLQDIHGLWRRVGTAVARKPRAMWVASLVLVLACSFGLLQLNATGVSQSDLILTKSQAVAGEKVASAHSPSGLGSPAAIVVDQDKAKTILDAVTATAGIDSATIYAGNGRPGTPAGPLVRDGKMLINAVLTSKADSHAAEQLVRTLGADLAKVDPGVRVGGVTAIALDTNTTAESDIRKIISIVLVVSLFILMLLLRSIVAALLLIGSGVGSSPDLPEPPG